MNWRRFTYLLPSRRRQEEREMQEEFDSLAQIADPRELGNLTCAAENARATWGWTWLEGILADVRYAFRTLRRQPGFVAVAVISLALGIGANTAMFSLADSILLRPLPVFRPSEVLTITNTTLDNPFDAISYPDYQDLRNQCRSFSGLIAYKTTPLRVAIEPNAPPQIRLSVMVSDNFFDVLGVAPFTGRTLSREEGRSPGRDRIAILAYDFWNNWYNHERSAIGRTVRLNGVEFTIIGVAPKSFPGLNRWLQPALFVPLSMWSALADERAEPLEDRGRHELTVKGRLRSTASLQSAEAEVAAISRNLERAYPSTNHGRQLSVRTEIQAHLQQVPQHLILVTMLMILVGLVLTIACANVANLNLARARARSREIAIRLAIGAGRFRLIRQMMTESLMVALLGGLAGLAFGYGGILFLSTVQIPSDLPFNLGLEIDTRVLAVTLLAALASCLLFGLVPALQAARVQLIPALKGGGDAVILRRKLIGRNALVVSEIALATVLLIAAGIFRDEFRGMLTIDPGFRTDHLISMDLDPSLLHYSPERTHDFYRELLESVRELPSVRSVALTETLPFSISPVSVAVVPEGYQSSQGRETISVFGGAVDENYFDTMKIPILRGRALGRGDSANSRRTAVVNEQFAKTYWPNQDPIGKRLRLNRSDAPPIEVVGIAKTGRYLFPTEAPTPYVYLPYEQNRPSRMTLVAESFGNPADLAGPLRGIVHSIDVDEPIQNLRTVSSYYEKRVVGNFLILLEAIATMGIMGLTLATVGLYGLISYSVTRRTREIGVRMAIGASRGDVLGSVLHQGLVLALAGTAFGVCIAALAAPAIASGVIGLTTNHTATFLVVPALLLLVSVAACYLPARRAATLDPIRAIRCE